MLNIKIKDSDNVNLPKLHMAQSFFKGKTISNVNGLDILQKYFKNINYDLNKRLLDVTFYNDNLWVNRYNKAFYNIVTVINIIEESYGQPFDKDRYISFLNSSLISYERSSYDYDFDYEQLDTSIDTTLTFKDKIKFKEDITLVEVVIKIYTSLDLATALLVLEIFEEVLYYADTLPTEG